MTNQTSIGIIGGGVSGSTIGLQLAREGYIVQLFEQKQSLVNGPPFCHLHAGGNLYPEISLEQCKDLMRQSIQMVRLFPNSIDYRPTLFTFPKHYRLTPDFCIQRLEQLVDYYKTLIAENPKNKVLGNPDRYYKIYSKEDIKSLQQQESIEHPQGFDEWMIEPAKIVDWEKLQFPVIMVNEFGWNIFRLGAQAQEQLNGYNNVQLHLNTEVKTIKEEHKHWKITTNDNTYKVDFLVNAAGYKTGVWDNMANIDVDRLVEFKAAYVSKWNNAYDNIPELIFHGDRGSENGMAQLTPYPNGYFQIHGMTETITLFENGLASSTKNDAQPHLPNHLEHKLTTGWDKNTVTERTKNAIEYMSKFVPSFHNAQVGGKPLFGAQQIPGKDASLRVAAVSFPKTNYARCEAVKASSAYESALEIIDHLSKDKLVKNGVRLSNKIAIQTIEQNAIQFATERSYPEQLACVINTTLPKSFLEQSKEPIS